MEIQDWFVKKKLTIAVGTDHGGWELKQWLIPWLTNRGLKVMDCGPYVLDPADDYPDFANRTALAVSCGEADLGLLICRSGVGMGINANRYPNVRAVVAYSGAVAKASRNHNCSNVLVLPADYASVAELCEIAEAWLETPFSGDERHVKRLLKIENQGFYPNGHVLAEDPELGELIRAGEKKRAATLDLVASENHTDTAVRSAMATYLTDKYAEGMISARLYPDCGIADKIEQLCIDRACRLFGADAANVQPYSGSIANLAVYHAVLTPGATVMAMHPGRGGHSTHFSKNHISGKHFKVVEYELDPTTEMIDYHMIEKAALSARPALILAGGSSYVRNLDFARFRQIADKAGALLMVDMAHVAGLVAAGIYPSPVPYADIVTTTTHKTLRGPRGGLVLCRQKYIDAINKALFPLIQGGPLMHVIAAKAIALKEASSDAFKDYQRCVVENARTLCKLFKSQGLRVVTGSTDCHMLLLDLSSLKVDGVTAAKALEKSNINVNPIRILSDPLGSAHVSGIRIGTSVVTGLGMGEPEMTQIVEWVIRICRNPEDVSLQQRTADEIAAVLTNLRVGSPII